MGEDNSLMNRYLHIMANKLVDKVTPASMIPGNENIKRLVKAIGYNQFSVNEMIAVVGLKDRKNFLEHSLSPALNEGYIRMLYQDSLRHPGQNIC